MRNTFPVRLRLDLVGMLLRVLLLFLGAIVSVHCVAQPNSPKRDAIRQLVEVSISGQSLWSPIVDPIVSSGRRANPAADPKVWVELDAQIKQVVVKAASAPGGPIYRTIARYDERFTEAEIQELLKFFSSDVGRKFTREQTLLQVENDAQMEAFVKQLLPDMQRSITSFFKERGLRLP